jgi:hypothetical protein
MAPADQPDLPSLAEGICREHAHCRNAMRQGLRHALEAGRLLAQAKDRLPHGEWLPWLAEHCPDVSPRLAQKYMRVARELPRLDADNPANTPRVADMSFRQALDTIADAASAARAIPELERADVLDAAAEDPPDPPEQVGGRPARESERRRWLRTREHFARLREQIAARARDRDYPRPDGTTRSIEGLPEYQLLDVGGTLQEHQDWYQELQGRLAECYEHPVPRLAHKVVAAIHALRERLAYDRQHLRAAVRGLLDLLRDGPAPAKDIERWARQAYVSAGLLALASGILRVRRLRPTGGGPETWALPEEGAPAIGGLEDVPESPGPTPEYDILAPLADIPEYERAQRDELRDQLDRLADGEGGCREVLLLLREVVLRRAKAADFKDEAEALERFAAALRRAADMRGAG